MTAAATFSGVPSTMARGASTSPNRVRGKRGAASASASTNVKSTMTRSCPCRASSESVPTRSSRPSGETIRARAPVRFTARANAGHRKLLAVQSLVMNTTSGRSPCVIRDPAPAPAAHVATATASAAEVTSASRVGRRMGASL